VTDWPAIIADLRALGWRLIDIGAEIDQDEPWVSRIGRGVVRKVDYDTGRKLLELHERECSRSIVPRGTTTEMQVCDASSV